MNIIDLLLGRQMSLKKVVHDTLFSTMSLLHPMYNTIEDALEETNATANGKVCAFTDDYGVHRIFLFDDISSASIIEVTKDCSIHLNGHTISFTADGSYLDVKTASEVSIDGTVSGSKIVAANFTSPTNKNAVIKATGTHLTITGGTYAMENINCSEARAIRAGTTATQIDMNRCTVRMAVTSTGTGKFMGCAIASGKLTDCTIIVEANNADVSGVVAFADVTMTNCTVNVKAIGQNCIVFGARANSSSSLNIINCNITADGYGDALVGNNILMLPVAAVRGEEAANIVNIIGGHYKAAREALSIKGKVRIDGGLYEGCQHGGGYLASADIKVKNATFRNIAYFGDCGWDAEHFGSCYCGDSTDANVTLYKCSFETDGTTAHYGMRTKGTNCNTYISDCEIGSVFARDLSVDAGSNIFVGKNVVYRQDKVEGSIDTTTYAEQSFAW